MEVILIAAITTDGFIGRARDDRSFDWTSKADKEFYVKQIKAADAIIMGAKTFQTFKRHPRGSRWEIYTRCPEKFVNKKPAVIQASGTNESPQALLARLKKEGLKKIIIAGGASIYTLFMEAGLVDKIYLTLEPIFFGDGIKVFSKTIEKKLKLIGIKSLSKETTLLELAPKN